MSPVDSQCPSWASALGYMGVAAAVCLSNWGSAVSVLTATVWVMLLGQIDSIPMKAALIGVSASWRESFALKKEETPSSGETIGSLT
jgi:hypothetical protein